MFFEYGTKGKMKSLGNTAPIVCLHCGKEVSMLVMQGYDNLFVLGVPLKEVDKIYFAACPSCAAVFALEGSQAAAFARGQHDAVTAKGLSPAAHKVTPHG